MAFGVKKKLLLVVSTIPLLGLVSCASMRVEIKVCADEQAGACSKDEGDGGDDAENYVTRTEKSKKYQPFVRVRFERVNAGGGENDPTALTIERWYDVSDVRVDLRGTTFNPDSEQYIRLKAFDYKGRFVDDHYAEVLVAGGIARPIRTEATNSWINSLPDTVDEVTGDMSLTTNYVRSGNQRMSARVLYKGTTIASSTSFGPIFPVDQDECEDSPFGSGGGLRPPADTIGCF